MLDPEDATTESSGPDGGSAEPELDKLRRLILAVERERLDDLEHRLDDPDVRAEEVSLVLPESVARAARDGNRLSLALAPAVRYECLADALDNRIEFGVWGGMTERERRALLRRHPHVASWRKMFETALREQGDRERVLVSAG